MMVLHRSIVSEFAMVRLLSIAKGYAADLPSSIVPEFAEEGSSMTALVHAEEVPLLTALVSVEEQRFAIVLENAMAMQSPIAPEYAVDPLFLTAKGPVTVKSLR